MKLPKIGLIGGMSFESTVLYYRKINEAVNRRLGGLNSAEIVLQSVNFQNIVDLQKAGRWDDAGIRLTDAVAAATDLPLIHVVDETAKRLKASGCSKPLLLATRYTMENGFYPARMKPHGIDVIVPDTEGRTLTHNIIFEELSAGKVLDSSRRLLVTLIEKAKAQGADSVIFGCTEICMILEADKLPLPGFDSTAIHVAAAVEFALGHQSGEAA